MRPDPSSTAPPIDHATRLARQARHAGLLAALRGRPATPLTQLIRLVSTGKYASDLREIRVEELQYATILRVAPGETPEAAVMRVFRAFDDQWLSSGFFCRYLDLERWTAQKICVELAERGRLERRGRTSATRYRLELSERSEGGPP